MLGLLVILFVTPHSYAGFPLSIHGARARWDSQTAVAYHSEPWLNLGNLKVEALQLETGKRLPFTVQGQVKGEWIVTPSAGWNALGDWAREPYVLTVSDLARNELDRTYFQLGGLLDSLYKYDGCLGVCWQGDTPTLKVWAPTARNVSVFRPDTKAVLPMRRSAQGVWSLEGKSGWKNQPYLYLVEVFTPVTGNTEKYLVTDPYSIALSQNSRASLLVQPDDAELAPAGWESDPRPPLAARTDAVLYELHVREFSEADETVPVESRGLFKAFTLQGTNGDKHLRELAKAGITHIHLMPVNDFATVEENPAARLEPNVPKGLPPDSPIPQQELSRVKSLDAFNWGYDPFHYFAPEGSYSANPDSTDRVREFRELVSSLHARGLRVVLDVVFNHTFSSGIAGDSVLDKIVPGYYYRLDNDGNARNTSCCSDTASERWMMEKLMRDALESWRTVFKVDGFRFDLMNLHSVSTMGRIRDYLRQRDPSLLLYGEAWPFGSLYETSPDAYTQERSFGQGIGIFNDRIRDAIRGGTTDSREKSDQGFLTGLFYDFNQEPANRNTPVDLGAQRDKLLYLTDVVRMGLAGNLRDYSFRGVNGNWVTGGTLSYNGGPTGYAASPEETINYVSAHDGYTFFDALQAKLPFHNRSRNPSTATITEKVDRQILAVGLLALSQGIPFFDSGIEMLRSKSGDHNSYDSGDWFNRLDWSRETNSWGRGLPPDFSNQGDWTFWRPRLADNLMVAQKSDIERMNAAFLALVKLRKNSALFRLPTAEDIKTHVHFLETELGPMQPPGIIVMEINDDERDLDPNWERMLVAVNVTNDSVAFPSSWGSLAERLYGVGKIEPNGQISIPSRSITVWGER